MSALGPFAIPILAAGAFAATLGWFGYQHVTRKPELASHGAAASAAPSINPDGVKATHEAALQPSALPTSPAQPAPATPAPIPAPMAAQPTPEPPAPGAPAFDVVRVEPTGETVIAGRASPGATVEMVLNGTRYARVVADPSGLFALVPEPLPAGSHEVSLQVTNGDGTKLRSAQSATIVVAANRREPPLVTITAPGQPAVVLSRPDAPAVVASAKPDAIPAPAETRGAAKVADPAPSSKTRRVVQIVSVETEGAGRLLVSGSASPAAIIRLYLNDSFIAPASAGADGRLSFSIERGMQPGAYKVRLDDVDPVSGQVRSRAEVPFAMPQQVASADLPGGTGAAVAVAPGADGPPRRLAAVGAEPAQTERAVGSEQAAAGLSPSVIVPEIATAIVSRGDSLWAISKRTYGAGPRYTVIYGANAKQIRDPDLIYPGQLFVLPIKEPEAAGR